MSESHKFSLLYVDMNTEIRRVAWRVFFTPRCNFSPNFIGVGWNMKLRGGSDYKKTTFLSFLKMLTINDT